MNLAPPVTAALEALLHRVLASRPPPSATNARVALLAGGPELPVTLNGLAIRFLHVTASTTTEPRFRAAQRLVLRIVLGDGATRIDIPVEVAGCRRTSIVLRMVAEPLVLRRRMIRDRALEEALDVRPGWPRPQLVA